VFVGVCGVVRVYDEGRDILNSGWDEAQLRSRDSLFIAKIEMTMSVGVWSGRWE